MMTMPGVILMQSTSGDWSAQVSDETHPLIETTREMSKPMLELYQFEHFERALKRNMPALALKLKSAQDRPDFIARRNGKEVGVDMAAFAFEEWRAAAAQFRRFKESLRDAHRRGRLRTCGPVQVQLSFRNLGMPLARLEDKTLDELIAMLEALTVNESTYILMDAVNSLGGAATMRDPAWMPYPLGTSGRLSSGAAEWTCNCLLVPPFCSFVRECGFRVVNSYGHTVTPTELKERFDTLVETHDDPSQGIEELVIVAGGPDKYGDGLPGEAMLAQVFLTKWQGEIAPPKSIRRVFLDIWGPESLHLLYDADRTQ